MSCYILLPANTSVDDLNKQLRAFSHRVQAADDKDEHVVQALNAIHYDTQSGNYSNNAVNRQLLNVLWLIAGFILLIACVNFINLSTAQAVNRAKEVGVRKVLGSSKLQLKAQFMIETFLIVLSSVVLAIAITLLVLPTVGQLLELSLTLKIINDPFVILFLISTIVVVTIAAGFYPAILLSGFNPVNALKSKFSVNNANG